MRDDPYVVSPLAEIKLSRLLRYRLRRVRDMRETGLLMQGIIRTPTRSMSPKKPAVAIREGKARLCFASSPWQIPKWAPLAPGEHKLTFHAARSRSHSIFDRRFVVAEGDVLIAVCEPIQPWTMFAKSPYSDHWKIFAKSPSADHWYIGVVTDPKLP